MSKQKNFLFLNRKKFARGRLKKCLENFSVLLAEAKRGRAETLDGTIQNPLADFVQRMFELRPKDTADREATKVRSPRGRARRAH